MNIITTFQSIRMKFNEIRLEQLIVFSGENSLMSLLFFKQLCTFWNSAFYQNLFIHFNRYLSRYT